MKAFGIKAIVISAFLLVLPAMASSQTTWYVDGNNTGGDGSQGNPFQYIQQGIDAASRGDTVLVMPYTYVENIDFIGKLIAVKSNDGPGTTIIDGNQAGSVVIFQNGEDENSILDGFTVQMVMPPTAAGYSVCFLPPRPSPITQLLGMRLTTKAAGLRALTALMPRSSRTQSQIIMHLRRVAVSMSTPLLHSSRTIGLRTIPASTGPMAVSAGE